MYSEAHAARMEFVTMPQVGESPEVLEWLEDARVKAGIRSQRELDSLTAKLGARISQAYYSLILNGHKKLSELGPEKMDALRQVLKISPEDWVEKTGYSIVTRETIEDSNHEDDDEPVRDRKPRERRDVPIPAGLQQLIDEYSQKWPELQDPDLQQGLAQMRRRGPGPETFEEWEEFFAATRKHFRRRDPK